MIVLRQEQHNDLWSKSYCSALADLAEQLHLAPVADELNRKIGGTGQDRSEALQVTASTRSQ